MIVDDRKRTGQSRLAERRERFANVLYVLLAFLAFEATQVLVERYWDRDVRQRIDLLIVGAVVMEFGVRGLLRMSRRRGR
jgi:hypothetical protein